MVVTRFYSVGCPYNSPGTGVLTTVDDKLKAALVKWRAVALKS